MMGYQPVPQGKLFYYGINLEERIRSNHPLRKIKKLIDFDFTYKQVRDKYGDNGNVSVAPPVILKLMMLLILYNVRSERELMDTLPERLDWLWFLDYDLDSEIENHSILSKARKRWGVETFQMFFERIVFQCVQAGLVDGSKIFMDSSFVDADASRNSVVDTHSLKRYLNKNYRELEKRLADVGEVEKAGTINKRYVSTTDSDSSIVRTKGTAKPCYKVHRAVDSAYEVITATEVTPGEVNEAHRLTSLLNSSQANTEKAVKTVVADSKYGTVDNFVTCYDKKVSAHIPDLSKRQENSGLREGIFSADRFIYRQETDTYTCPAGKSLTRKSLHKNRQSTDYAAKKSDCARCELREQCTQNKSGRSVKRHLEQEKLDQMRNLSDTAKSRRDIKTRQHLMERSFARACRYGFKQARWRGLWRVKIQEYLTATIQNIQVLIRYGTKSKGKAATILTDFGDMVMQLTISFFSNSLSLKDKGTFSLAVVLLF